MKQRKRRWTQRDEQYVNIKCFVYEWDVEPLSEDAVRVAQTSITTALKREGTQQVSTFSTVVVTASKYYWVLCFVVTGRYVVVRMPVSMHCTYAETEAAGKLFVCYCPILKSLCLRVDRLSKEVVQSWRK
jgi:hypothetical protein